MKRLISRGAEAILFEENSNSITKERIKKGYRIAELDQVLRKKRTRTELRLLREVRRSGVNVPSIVNESDYSIEMELIHGNIVKNVLNECDDRVAAEIANKIGETIAQLHSYDIIHGDLTTSNMILSHEERLYIIDFGLGFFSKRTEDKSMDLHMLYEVLKATHPRLFKMLWDIILKVYQERYLDAKVIIKIFQDIEKRGRYVKR